MDPAGWYIKGMPNYVRLDPSDAQFVDAVHTDGDNAYISIPFKCFKLSNSFDQIWDNSVIISLYIKVLVF